MVTNLFYPLIPLIDRVTDLFASIRYRSFKEAGEGGPTFTFCFHAGVATARAGVATDVSARGLEKSTIR